MLRPLGDCVTDVHWQDGRMLLRGKGWMQGWPSQRIFLFHSTWTPSDLPDQWCRLEGRSRTTSARKISPAGENRIRTQLLPTLWWQVWISLRLDGTWSGLLLVPSLTYRVTHPLRAITSPDLNRTWGWSGAEWLPGLCLLNLAYPTLSPCVPSPPWAGVKARLWGQAGHADEQLVMLGEFTQVSETHFSHLCNDSNSAATGLLQGNQ